jgi:hypothetical protein
MRIKFVLPAAALTIAVLAALTFTGTFSRSLIARQMPGYQAVLLDNNQVYYGILSGLNTDYPVLTDVFYVQTAVNTETKQASNILLKRGKEWHAPDRMMLSARHIIMVEPVTPGSTVAKLIQQANQK